MSAQTLCIDVARQHALEKISEGQLYGLTPSDAHSRLREKRDCFGGTVQSPAQITFDARPPFLGVAERFRVPDHAAGNQRIDRGLISRANPQREPVLADRAGELRSLSD